MKMILKSLHIENFKGIKSLDVNFSEKTKIKGQNAAGKTTIFDAFTWLLFNKNSAGEEKFNVRPLDKDGNRVDNVEIKVVAVLDVDGKEVELSKVQKQNWVKKRGTDTVTLQGNVNSFEIDGYPKSESDFKAYVSGLAQSEDMFKMLTNPQYFSSLKWKEQRDILMKLIADFSDVELAKTDAKYAPLLDELEKAPSTDDIRSKFSKELTEWKKKRAEIPVRIDEAEKSKVDVDVAEQELAKADLTRKIAEIDGKIANSGSAIGDLRSREMQLQFDMSGIMQVMSREVTDKRRKLDDAIFDAGRKVDDLKNQIQIAENQIKLNEKAISDADAERKNLGVKYNAEKAKAFDETPYQFDESKCVFDDSTTVCSLCGQKLPDDKIEQIKADFETRKAKAKADAEEKLKKTVLEYINSNNTCALATGTGDYVRCTPIEYSYHDGKFWMFSEGGEKFIGLEKNENVCLLVGGQITIYDKYDGADNLKSIQVIGKADLVEPFSDTYNKHAKIKKLPVETLKKLASPMNLICVTPVKMEVLFSEFKKNGYSSRQTIKF